MIFLAVQVIDQATDQIQNAAGFNNSPHSGHGAGGYPSYIETGPQYQSPQHTFAGVPSTHYHPRSNMTSFSTTRNGSASSYTSLRPAFSSQSSLNHRTLSQMPMSGHVDYLNQGGFNLHSMERGFEHDGAHDEHTFPDADDEHEGFDGLFGESRKSCNSN